MTIATPESAADMLCPLARTFATQNAQKGCRGPECAAWRWIPISADDPRFVEARKKVMADLGGGAATHAKAVAIIMADLEAHGIPKQPERGFCGMAGKP